MRYITTSIIISLLLSLSAHAVVAPNYLDYNNIDCEALGEVASSTMKKWQYGSNFKEMLEYSSVLKKKLADSSDVSIESLGPHTYTMATLAMDRPVHDEVELKDYETELFAKDYLETCLSEKLDYMDWRLLHSFETGNISIMPSTYAVDELGYPNMWFRYENYAPKDNVYVSEILHVANCEARKIGISHVVNYDNKANKINEAQIPTFMADMKTLSPNDARQEVYDLLCE